MSSMPASPIVCYLIPGLGATAEIFDKLELPAFVKRQPIDWIKPCRGEPLKDYAKRLLPQISQAEPFIIVGCSFGGAVAIELAKLSNPQMTVLISSIPSSLKIPNLYRRARWLCAYHAVSHGCQIPSYLLRAPLSVAFGLKDPEALDVLCRQVQASSPEFLYWAVSALMNWHCNAPPENLLHIHGYGDRILPMKNMTPDIIIPGGGHLVVYTHGREIGEAISRRLAYNGFGQLDRI